MAEENTPLLLQTIYAIAAIGFTGLLCFAAQEIFKS